jgi:hypothetical protein
MSKRTVQHDSRPHTPEDFEFAAEPGFLTSGFLLATPSHLNGQWQACRVRSGYSGGGRAGFSPASLNSVAPVGYHVVNCQVKDRLV